LRFETLPVGQAHIVWKGFEDTMAQFDPFDKVSEEAFARANALSHGLFPHQVEGVAFLLGRRRAILADDMGLGKSRQAIIALKEAAAKGPYLVICPASVKRNWAWEIELALPGAACRVVEGAAALELSDAEWVIINYDILAKRMETLRAVRWAGLIVDEAHYLKNHKSQRSKQARDLTERCEDLVVYALTGTPMTNRPRDLFPLLQLMDHPLGRSFLSFAKRYCDAYQIDYGWVTDGASNLEELIVQLHGVMLRRDKSQVLCLPPKLRTWLELDTPPHIASKEMTDVVRLLIANQAGRAGGRRTRQGRAATGQTADRIRLLALLSKARHKIAVAKTAATIDFVDGALAQGEKVLVFSCFDAPLQKIAAHFGEQAVLLTGATPSARRQDLVDRFQTGEGTRVFVANIQAGGVGLNLTSARQVVFNDLDWVPANHWQAEDRAYRLGQTGTVNVTYMIARDTLDAFVQILLEAKSRLVAAVVEREAQSGGIDLDVLGELEHALRALSPGLADMTSDDIDADVVAQVLRAAAARQKQEPSADGIDAGVSSEFSISREALLALARALSGPQETRYRIASQSKQGAFYELTVDAGGDVVCSCPGFEYRGMCRHARDLKTALAAGKPVPAGYQSG
jgi:SWI/SNF-related matrix-associated actin-dependent regulator 1 of chromatin subfamily A